MIAEHWTLVKSIFSRAMLKDTSSREGWLRNQIELPGSVVQEALRLLKSSSPAKSAAFDHCSYSDLQDYHLFPGDLLLERFDIVERLGCGAMGDVYRSFDRSLGEHIAIKTLRSHLANHGDLVRRLSSEVQLARRVQHDNVCRVYELHRDLTHPKGAITFFTMELLQGETLAHWLEGNDLALDEALRIARPIASGLNAIHSLGLIHRDLKSSNIFLVKDDAGDLERVVITDFGLCFDERRPVSESISVFGANAVVGTPAYMSPEQLQGSGVTQQGDIYSFGVLLFELVTGRLPIEGDTPLAIALKRLQQTECPSPKNYRPDLPKPWELAILASLSNDPLSRPKSAFDVIGIIEGTVQVPRVLVTRRRMVAFGVGVATVSTAAIGVRLWTSRDYVPSLEAARHFQLGREYVKQPSPAAIKNAIGEFRQATAIDPEFGEAWAGLADAYCMASTYSVLPSRQARKDAEKAAERALTLNKHSTTASAAYAYALSTDVHRWREAEGWFRKAIAVHAKEPLVCSWYAGYLGRLGRHDEAISMAELAVKLDPASFRYNLRVGTELFRARKFVALVAHMKELIRLHPGESSGYWALARGYEWLAKFSEAEDSLRSADGLPNKSAATAYWATLFATMGKITEANRLADRIGDDWRLEKHETNSYLSVLGSLRNIDKIFQVLGKAIQREDETALAAATNPYLEFTSKDSRFAALLRQLGYGAS